MTQERLSLGRWGEDEATRHLRRQGMVIVARNLRTPLGEIDIIARQGRVLAFVEVKTRRSKLFGTPQEAVGRIKQRQIVRAAQWYLGDGNGRGLQPRFDVVAVWREGESARIEHIVDAFSLPG
jgi:putative endonuclease